MPPSTRAVAILPGLALALAASSAAAQMPEGPEPAWERTPAVRRSGFTAGVAVGGALGMAAGYPNDAKKIGRAAHYTETGIGPGGAGAVWIGGALADWFTFGVGLAGDALAPSEGAIQNISIFFKVESFPLFSFGGLWRELGVGLEAGTGSGTVTEPEGETRLIDGGAPARLGVTAFYEGLRLWKISTGPFAGTNYMWSETIRRGELVLGWRTVVYAGP